LFVSKAQNRPTGGLQKDITPAVRFALATSLVVTAIDFNDQRCLEAAEIDDHRTERLLPPKLDPQLSVPQ
jgi:hypothetical protein